MRIFMTLLLLSICSWALQAEKDVIIQSGECYYGSGTSTNMNEARDQAIEALCQQISVHVSSRFERVVEERNLDYQEKVESIIKTHSMATLSNVHEISKQLPGDRFEVFCFLEKSEVEKIFNERRKLVAEITSKADLFVQEMNLAHALKYYYFAILLLHSLPDQNMVYQQVNYTTQIPLRIIQILDSVDFRFESAHDVANNEREITLQVIFKEKTVGLLDFFIWDGTNQVTVTARDGKASFRLFGGSTQFNEIRAQPKYAYYEARNEYPTVGTLWPLVVKPEFNRPRSVRLSSDGRVEPSVTSVSIKESAAVSAIPVQARIQTASSGEFNIRLDFEEQVAAAPVIVDEVQNFLNVLKSQNPEAASRSYSADTFLAKKVADYIRFNHPEPLDQNVAAALNKTTDGWELRRLRMLHSYPSLHKQTTEYLTLDFTPQGKLYDLNVCITDYLYQRFVNEAFYGQDWNNRQQIIKFLEKYRTAYLTRDLPTVDLMFADDAIIIIGRKLEGRKLPEHALQYNKLNAQPDIEYLRLTKEQYLQRQKQIFSANQDISLDFSTFNIVKKNARDSVYGVEMRQNYASTLYADEGYLFLLVDFHEKDPLIYVRAWQPNAWSPDELINAANFKIYK